ncbi:MAG TPA: AI-2E family transporter, partial [Candidatus Saccharimonadales bacterium]|nr:AI-2E family transporter [Candidatus Saccharimonadales bacterium]
PWFDEWRLRLWPRRSGEVPRQTALTNSTIISTNIVGGTNTVVNAAAPENAEAARFSESVLAWIREVAPVVGNWLWAQVSRVASWAGMIVGIAMVPVFTFYFLREKEQIQKGWTRYVPLQESWLKDESVFVLSAINNYLIVFFRGQVLIAFCNAVMLTLGFLMMGLNYAVLLGLTAGFLSIVPYLGTVVTIIPTVVLAAVQFRDLLHPLLVVGVFSIVHLIEGFVISPKVMGDRVGLHPLTIIVAVLVGTTLLGGILGGILAIPLTAAMRVLMFRYVWKPTTQEVTVQV